MSLVLTNSHPTVTGELIDALIEAVVLPPDPQTRSEVICDLVQEISDAVEWQYPTDTVLDDAAHGELKSIRQVALAAHDHQRRMNAATAGATATGT